MASGDVCERERERRAKRRGKHMRRDTRDMREKDD